MVNDDDIVLINIDEDEKMLGADEESSAANRIEKKIEKTEIYISNQEDISVTKSIISNIISIVLSLLAIIFLFVVFANIHYKKEAIKKEGIELTLSDNNIEYRPENYNPFSSLENVNILMLGDDLLSYTTDETSIPHMLAKKSGAKVTSLAIPGLTCAVANTSYDSSDPSDIYSLFYVTNMILSHDFDLLKNAWEDMEDSKMYQLYWDTIHKLDYSSYDVVILCYGTNDYISGIPVQKQNEFAESKYGEATGTMGALDISIKRLKKSCPNAIIIVLSPCPIKVDDNDKLIDEEVFEQYINNMHKVAKNNEVIFLDNYYGPDFNYQNCDNYLDGDGRYPNKDGRKFLVDHIIWGLTKKY